MGEGTLFFSKKLQYALHRGPIEGKLTEMRKNWYTLRIENYVSARLKDVVFYIGKGLMEFGVG